MKAWVSLWSADQLALGDAVDRLDGHADGFHIDVMDGHFVKELLFGPELVRAVAERARASLIDVHLMVDSAQTWIEPFVCAGADLVTIHVESCTDPAVVLRTIEMLGARPALALSLARPLEEARELLELVDRVLLMGTELGVKGVDLDPATYSRIRQLVAAREASVRKPEIVIDGGIRTHTVPLLARAGADGVVPGSLIFGEPRWFDAISRLHRLPGPR